MRELRELVEFDISCPPRRREAARRSHDETGKHRLTREDLELGTAGPDEDTWLGFWPMIARQESDAGNAPFELSSWMPPRIY